MKLELIYTFENGQDFLTKEIPETFLKTNWFLEANGKLYFN